MQFDRLAIAGAFLIRITPHADERGFFARTVCEITLTDRGLVGRFRQSSISFNHQCGTIRGLHYTTGPDAETKIVRCVAGAIYDVIVDLRKSSASYLQSVAVTLTAENRNALYIPPGIAHGFQTLEDRSEILYQIDPPHVATAGKGLRWDDPMLDIKWPKPITAISERDRTYPDWRADMDLP